MKVSEKFSPVFMLMIAVLLISFSCGENTPVQVSSPDGAIVFSLTTNGKQTNDTLTYDVSFKGQSLISDAKMGVVFKDNDLFSNDLSIIKQRTRTGTESYEMSHGKASHIEDSYTEATYELQDKSGRKIDVIVRLFNDAVAFRYRFHAQDGIESMEITGEKSHFDFTGDFDCWSLRLESYTTSQEDDYIQDKLSTITPETLCGAPLLVKASDTMWAAVTEANLTNYAGMYLRGCPDKKERLVADLSPLPNESGVAAHIPLPFVTPWRVVMIADDPGRLVESTVITSLNDPCEIDDSWIKPGKTSWDWWSGQIVKNAGFEGTMDNRTMKHYVDFSADMELEYMLVDAGWYGDHADGSADILTQIPGIDIPELVQYANAKGVDILLWLNWQGVNRQMDEAFALYESWGVKGVKIDYMNRDDQEMVNFYHRTVKKAAEHKLLVDFHGAYKPTGFRRTYPNLITREGIMGLEYCKWSERITPDHNCTIPYTRMLAGPMDYTPGGFTNTAEGQFSVQFKEPMTMGTRCHQLALYVIFESPLQMLVDYPENYRGKDGLEFLRHVPATWDESHVLTGEVGDFIVMARRKGEEWYVGGITDWTPRDLEISLSFLGVGNYTAEFYSDGDDAATNAESVAISSSTVTSSDSISLKMGSGGGTAVRFVKQ